MMRDKLPTFRNLKQLVLLASGSTKDSLLGFAALLEAAPFLQIFELHFCCSVAKLPREMQEETISKCTHYHLKNAVALKKMKIRPTFSNYRGNGKWEVCWNASGWTNRRKTVCKLLQREAPPGVQLVIL
ncbi:hypothetical protein HHK36_029751 [Tetracentron sinense]|uniref:Uncharacterized protein n=1 Tax=Tetracentron sinense TaxID=13715 RepID=A0A835CZM4_TETSI|nr:hypothetical protein HHK36_029751 [Tetracentron sinense]